MGAPSAAELAAALTLLLSATWYTAGFVLQNGALVCFALVFFACVVARACLRAKSAWVCKALRLADGAARILLLVGFFIVVNNVFLMRPGAKHCATCAVATRASIAGAYAFAAAYLSATFYLGWSFVHARGARGDAGAGSSSSMLGLRAQNAV